MTEKQTHTPIPWHIKRGTIVDHDHEQTIRGPIICDCAMTHGLGDARLVDEANAEFIVRSVNVHDELVAVLTELVDDGECYCSDNAAAKGPCGWCKARAAIRKATGGATCKP